MKHCKSKFKNKIPFFILCFSFLILSVTGCQPSEQSQQIGVNNPNSTQVILIGTDIFPLEMVGIWHNEQFGWLLRFDNDGRITKLRHTIGRANLAAGEISTFPLIDGGQGVIEPGLWQVEYLAETDEVVVDILLSSFEYDIPHQGIISGSSRDIFISTVPKAGETTWTAHWISKPEYTASTEDEAYQNYKLPFKAGDEDKGEIVFEKIDPGKPQHEH